MGVQLHLRQGPWIECGQDGNARQSVEEQADCHSRDAWMARCQSRDAQAGLTSTLSVPRRLLQGLRVDAGFESEFVGEQFDEFMLRAKPSGRQLFGAPL